MEEMNSNLQLLFDGMALRNKLVVVLMERRHYHLESMINVENSFNFICTAIPWNSDGMETNMTKVLSKIAEITGWIFTIFGVVFAALLVEDPKNKAIWILSIILAWVILAWMVTVFVFWNSNRELQKKVSTPQMSNCYIENYDKNDKTMLVSNVPMIAFHGLVTICYIGTGVPKQVGYGIVNLMDAQKSTIKILKLFDNYENLILEKLEGNKRSDLLDIYIQPLIYEDELKSVIEILEEGRGKKGGAN